LSPKPLSEGGLPCLEVRGKSISFREDKQNEKIKRWGISGEGVEIDVKFRFHDWSKAKGRKEVDISKKIVLKASENVGLCS